MCAFYLDQKSSANALNVSLHVYFYNLIALGRCLEMWINMEDRRASRAFHIREAAERQ